jgi:regulatory protein
MRARRPVPTAETLHAAALRYLARFAATEAGLARVLDRQIARWSREQDEADAAAGQAELARQAASEVVARLAAAGAVSDASFAEARARSLARAGRSGRAIASHLAQRGVSRSLAEKVSPGDAGDELAAALIHARRRRAGPFGVGATSPEATRRALASFARAGFSQDLARTALRMTRDEAELRIAAFRARL